MESEPLELGGQISVPQHWSPIISFDKADLAKMAHFGKQKSTLLNH